MATAVRRLTQKLSEEKASVLAKEAVILFESGAAERASRKLREAASLASDHADVQSAFLALHQDLSHDPLVDLCRRYAQYHDARAGDSAVEYLRRQESSSIGPVAVECLKLILETSHSQLSNSQDAIIAELAKHSLPVRAYFALELDSSTTEFFDNVYDRGDHAANCLRTVVLDPQLWTSEEIRLRVEDDLFQLFLAKLMESGHDHDGRALKGIALLLLADTQRLHHFIDEDASDALLTSLDFRLPPDVRGQATLVYSKFFEVAELSAQAYFTSFVTNHIQRGKSDDLILAFAAGAGIFPVAPSIVAQLLLTEGFLSSIMTMLPRMSGAATVLDSFLALLNAACIDGACRTAIQKDCGAWLSHMVSNGAGKQPAIAATILAKLRTAGVRNSDPKRPSMDHDVSDLVDLFQSNLTIEERNMSDSIEGLAYTSLNPEVKERLAKDQPFLKSLFRTLEAHVTEPEIVVGGLSIIANLTHYQPTLSEDQKKITQLKAYANASKPLVPSPLEDDEHVQKRCSAIVEAGVVSTIIKVNKSASSSTTQLIDTILLSISKTPKDRGKIAQQGAVKLLIAHAIKASQPPASPITSRSKSPHPQTQQHHEHHTAAHALARILISLNPSHIFPPSASPHITEAVAVLLTLLKQPSSEIPTLMDTASRDLLPVFEALLALTNLASSPDHSGATSVVRLGFSEVEDLLLSNHDLIRRAATELMCNLVSVPEGVVKFAYDSSSSTSKGQAKQRLRVLVAMADVDDAPTRAAAGGALAMMTEFPEITTLLLDTEDDGKRVLQIVLRLVAETDTDTDTEPEAGSEEQPSKRTSTVSDTGLVHRGLVVLLNLINQDGALGAMALQLIREVGGEDQVKEGLRRVRDPGVLNIGVDVLKKLKGVS